jgi:putative DNA primase/helicase
MTNATDVTSSRSHVLTVTASELTPRRVDWLWEPRIPFGGLTVLAGPPGLGKSLLSVKLAADTTAGRLTNGERRHVVMLSAEDSLEHVVVPRLAAAGAALDHVHFASLDDPSHRQLVFPDGVEGLDEIVRERGARLVVIDPLSAHLSAKVNSWQDQSVRLALAPLAHLADRESVAVLIVAHLNKGQGTDPVQRLGGSIGIAAAARSVMLLAADPRDDRSSGRVLAHVKSNLHELAPSVAYEIRSAEVPDESGELLPTAEILEVGESPFSGSELLVEATETESAPAVAEAVEFLTFELARGPRAAAELQEAAKEQGISWDAIKRAKRKLLARSVKPDFTSGWLWELPTMNGSAGES